MKKEYTIEEVDNDQSIDLLKLVLHGYKDILCQRCGKKFFGKYAICVECDEERVNRPTLVECDNKEVNVVNGFIPMSLERQKGIYKLTKHLWCAKRSPQCIEAELLDLDELPFYEEGRPLFSSAHWACPSCGKIKAIASYEELT